MGSTTPYRRSSRTRRVDEWSTAGTGGRRKKIGEAHRTYRTQEATTNPNRLAFKERFLSWNQSLIGHLLLVFSRLAWDSANARAIAWPQHNSAPASGLSRPPPVPEQASFARGRFSPASFELQRNPAHPATLAILSRHHPSCPDGGQFPRAHTPPPCL